MPRASTSTVSVKSSRERVAATRSSSFGIARMPATTMNATSRPTLASVNTTLPSTPATVTVVPTSVGSSTSMTMVRRSSTTSHPMAMWPLEACSSLVSESTRTSTTVLATDNVSPKTNDEVQLQPKTHAAVAPSSVATEMPAAAPGTATRFTASSSSAWNCRPTPNISRITPTSANCSAISASATKPGVFGPITTPASK